MSISRSRYVEASPDEVYDLVSDLPRMGELSQENAGGRWLGSATGAAVGARFRGTNRNGARRWSTTVQVERADRGRELAFAVSFWGIPVSRWTYTMAASESGCVVTEAWEDRRPFWFKTPAGLATGVMDRNTATARSIEHTLERVNAVLTR